MSDDLDMRKRFTALYDMNKRPQTSVKGQFRTWKLLAWAVGSVLTVLGIVAATMLWLGSQIEQSEFTSDTSVQQIIIGNDILDIPANYIRFARQRKRDVLDHIEIILLIPDGEGYSDEKTEQFRETSAGGDLVFLTILKRKMSEDMSGRVDTIYAKLTEPDIEPGPAELVFQRFKKGKGYDGEVLALHHGEGFVWAARCQSNVETISPTCLRDINVGETLSARFRFSTGRLKDWRLIEGMVRQKISDFLVN